jgi:hypothetical protein
MACTKKKMAKGGLVAKKRPAMRYAVGGAIAPPMDATDTWNASVGGPDFDAMQRKAGTAAAIAANQALTANPDAAKNISGRGMSFDEVAKKIGVAGATRALRGEPDDVPDQPAPPPIREEPVGPGGVVSPTMLRRRPTDQRLNFDNLLGLADTLGQFGRTDSGLAGADIDSLSLGRIGQDQSPLGQFRRGGTVSDYRMGGPVAGGPPGVDTVPARLNNGEYVLPVQTTQAFGGKPALDQAVLATTGKPPVGYEGGGIVPADMPYTTPYERDIARSEAGMNDFGLNGISRQDKLAIANLQMQAGQQLENRFANEDKIRYGDGYADGGQASGWNVNRAAQIENAVSGAVGQPQAAPVATPPAAPGVQLSEGEQYALDSARAAEAAQAPKPSKFETLLRAMTGKPAGYAMGGEVQGYELGGQTMADWDKVGNTLGMNKQSPAANLGSRDQHWKQGFDSSPPVPQKTEAARTAPTPTPMTASAVEVPARMPPVEDRYNIRGWAEQARMLKEQEQGVPGTPQPRPVGMGLGAAADLLAARDYRNRNLTGPEFLGGHGPVSPPQPAASGPVMTPGVASGPALTPQEQQEIMALKPPAPPDATPTQAAAPPPQRLDVAPEYQGQVGQAILTNQNEADTAKNLNLGANIAPKPPLPASRMRNSLGITPEAFNQTGGGFLGTVGGAPAGVDDAEYAKMSPAQKSAAKVKSMNKATQAIRNLRNARREAEGSPPVGGWKRYLLEQQQNAKGAELNQDLFKETYKTALDMKSKAYEEQLKQARPQDAENIDALSKFVPNEGMDLALDVVNSAPKLPLAQKAALAGRVLSAYPTRAALREAAIAKLGGTDKWIGKNPTEDEIGIAMTDLLRQSMGVAPPK